MTHFSTPGVTYATCADFLLILDGLHYTAYLTQDFSSHIALTALQNHLIISKSLALKKIKENETNEKSQTFCICYKTRKVHKNLNKIVREQNFKSALPSRRNINRDILRYTLTAQMEKNPNDPMFRTGSTTPSSS